MKFPNAWLLILFFPIVLGGMDPPPEWKLFYGDGVIWEDPAAFSEMPTEIRAGGKTIRPISIRIENAPDLNKILNLQPKSGREALLFCEWISPIPMKIQMGAGADYWFSMHVNGKQVMSNFPKGNYRSYYNRFCYLFPISLKQGKNLLVMRSKSGNGGWQTAAGFVPFAPVSGHDTALFSRRAVINTVLPAKAQVTRGPFLFRLTKNTASISFQTAGLMAAGVEYRAKGARSWERVMDACGSQVNTSLDSHMITLTGLKPGTEYEYRILLFLKPKSPPEIIPAGQKGYYSFRTFDTRAKSYRFLVMADTQVPYLLREQTMKKLIQAAGKTALPLAFIGHLGDMSNECSNFELEVLRSLELFAPMPFVFVRGNHEHVGAESGMWNDYFAPDRKSYFAFRHGPAFFLVLDSGNNFRNQYGDLNSRLIREQRAWLEKILETEECRSAAFRIVFSHHANTINPKKLHGLTGNMIRLTEGLFSGKNPKCRIHLWLAGHIHSFLRTTPFAREFRCLIPPEGRTADGYKIQKPEPYPYTILTGEYRRDKSRPFTGTTVDVSGDMLEVNTFTPDGESLDRFRIRTDGTVENLSSAPQMKVY